MIIETDEDVERSMAELFGTVVLDGATVVHPTSVWRDERGACRVIRITKDSPVSSTDAIVLGAVRARANAIVTTGASLRAEPRLTHALAGRRRPGAALEAWRRTRCGLDGPPLSCVLTRSGRLPLTHRLFAEAPHVLVYTTPQGASRLETELRGRGLAHVELVADEDASCRALVARLAARFTRGAVSIEAGPTAARSLYDDPPVVDELFLSEFLEPELPRALRGPVLFEQGEPAGFETPRAARTRDEESGRWSFERRIRPR